MPFKLLTLLNAVYRYTITYFSKLTILITIPSLRRFDPNLASIYHWGGEIHGPVHLLNGRPFRTDDTAEDVDVVEGGRADFLSERERERKKMHHICQKDKQN